MIQNEIYFGNTAREFGDTLQLFMANANVEREIKFCKQSDTADKFRPQAKLQIAFALQIPAYSFHQRIEGELFQIMAESFAFFQRRMGNNPPQTRFVFCQTRNPIKLGKILRRLATRFDKYHFIYAGRSARMGIIRRKKRVVQGWQIVEPGIAELRWIPQMDVRIHDGKHPHIQAGFKSQLAPISCGVW